MKKTKEEFLEQILTRREAERYLELTSVAFQHHLRQSNILPVKEVGQGKGKVQLFWKEDLDKFKDTKSKEAVKMRTWEREGYKVEEREFDHDLHVFDVVKGNEVVATITPASIEDMEEIIADLDNGEDVNGWEDGMGNTIAI
jgi:hypothetical protein